MRPVNRIGSECVRMRGMEPERLTLTELLSLVIGWGVVSLAAGIFVAPFLLPERRRTPENIRFTAYCIGGLGAIGALIAQAM
jgi:hypothetical protein